jgi:hypothetical protein
MAEQHRLYSSHSVWIILLVFFVVLLYNLSGWGVVETSEARYAEISREMLVSGNWLHPRLLGILHYHKPPLTYIISAAGMALFGVNGFGLRFFLQVSFVLQALLVYGLGGLLFRSKRIAITAFIVYITIPAVLISARNLTTDSFLATFELFAIWAWVKYKLQRNSAWLYLFCISLGLAFLTKGPVGLIFPFFVMIGYAGTGTVGTKHHVLTWMACLLIFLVLSASWYVYLMLQQQQFIEYFLIRHTVERYANPETFSRSKPWWFFLVLTPALSLPWSPVLLFNLKKLKSLPAGAKRLFILWLLVPLLFFSLSSSKLILYILPFFAGQALLTAWLLHQLPEAAQRKAATGMIGYYACLAVGLLVGPLLPFGVALPVWVYAFPVLMLAGLYLIWRGRNEGSASLLLSAVLFTVLLIPYSVHLMGTNPEKINSSSHLAEVLRQKDLVHHQVIIYDKLLPSLAFELQRQFITVHEANRSLERETQFETNKDWRQTLLHLNQPEDSTTLVQLLQQNAVLVVKGELPPEKQWLIRSLGKRKKVGKWTLYY